ncbi:MAG TPA: ATP-dependent zinc metalloprotease FtsH [Microthrixaceae bacterium]|nr:ATP-dependent zinc metalloprotease FtsH [Microthrixaceae bacterium]
MTEPDPSPPPAPARPPRSPRRGRFHLESPWVRVAVAVAVGFVVVLIWTTVLRPDPPQELRLDQFQDRLRDDRVRTATIVNSSSSVEGELTDGTEYRTVFPEAYGETLTRQLLARGVEAQADNSDGSLWSDIVFGLLPTFLIVGVFVWFVLNMQRGGKALTFGRARTAAGDRAGDVTFADVAGADEAVTELREVVEYLRDPERFARLGARIPKGVLLVGPPGTGKTLLARAVAGEAGVPFLSLSGSDFVEMFVGVGASRVRDLFRQAVDKAPAIVFVDEIDAVGRHRGAGLGGGHDEREQTLNQLLVEMDGFAQTDGVVLIAATNRPDILDPALLRPGRFDRQVVVDTPDIAGRTAVLEVHLRGKPVADDVDVAVLARRTPGFSGADLANLVNEGALLAARRGGDRIAAVDLTAAVERVLAGPERSRILSEDERRVVAVHESGHAIVSHVLPHADEVHKVSIVSRGAALGYTVLLPEEDRHLHSRAQLSDQLAVALAGRAAEEAVFDQLTTGAIDDIQRATRLARAMVTEYGMSDKLGPRRLVSGDGEPFLGLDQGRPADHGAEVAARVDEEVSRLLDEAHERARRILEDHRPGLDRLASTLLERETVADAELADLLAAVGDP